MFEDSYLDSFMESYIGGWTGDEDRYYDDSSRDVWSGDPNQDEDSLMEYADEQDDWDDDTPGDGDGDYPDEVVQPDDWILDDGDF